jgi:hypothetical protein
MTLGHKTISLISVATTIIALLVAPDLCMSNESAERKATSKQKHSMAIKLAAAQESLEHLTSGDLPRLAASGRRLQIMNVLGKWLQDSEMTKKSAYRGELNSFEFATKELIRHAENDDVAGSLKAYVAMTESCVNCHTLIRDGKDVELR